MEMGEAKRLKELEAENGKLKKLLAETRLEKTALEDVVRRKLLRRQRDESLC